MPGGVAVPKQGTPTSIPDAIASTPSGLSLGSRDVLFVSQTPFSAPVTLLHVRHCQRRLFVLETPASASKMSMSVSDTYLLSVSELLLVSKASCVPDAPWRLPCRLLVSETHKSQSSLAIGDLILSEGQLFQNLPPLHRHH